MEMPEKVKTRRKYYSPLRAGQAEQTRRRILEAGFRLFVDRGYAEPTIAAVAEEAGVSPETIYLSLGGKRGLLEGVHENCRPLNPEMDDVELTLDLSPRAYFTENPFPVPSALAEAAAR